MSREYLRLGLSKRAGVYRIVNVVSGKYYIGSTKNFAKRWWEHRKQLRLCKHPNQHLQNAWTLYGEAAFRFEVVEECSADLLTLQVVEQRFLDEHVGNEHCYNINKLASGLSSPESCVQVFQLTKDGTLIKVWPSIAQAAMELEVDASCITNVCRGRLGSIGGYRWAYTSDPQELKHSVQHGGHNKREVVELSTNGETVAVYNSLAEAEKQTGIPHSSISMVCSGKRKTAKGRMFRYQESTAKSSFREFISSLNGDSEKYFLHSLRSEDNNCSHEYLIFQDEWIDRRLIVESMLRHSLGLSSIAINARQCKLVQLSKVDSSTFFEANHIAGHVPCTVAFGLLHGDEVVSAISLRPASFLQKKKGEAKMEIARFASRLNTRVRGSFSKLMKKVVEWCIENEMSSIVTYADERFGGNRAGETYAKNGFFLTGRTQRSFWYTDGTRRYPRLKFKAQANKSEKEVASENRVWRVYGSSNRIFLMELKQL